MFTNRESSFSALSVFTHKHAQGPLPGLLLLRWKDFCAMNENKDLSEEKFPTKEDWEKYVADLQTVLIR